MEMAAEAGFLAGFLSKFLRQSQDAPDAVGIDLVGEEALAQQGNAIHLGRQAAWTGWRGITGLKGFQTPAPLWDLKWANPLRVHLAIQCPVPLAAHSGQRSLGDLR